MQKYFHSLLAAVASLGSCNAQKAPETLAQVSVPAQTYEVEKGSFAVEGVDEIILHDSKRGKDLPLTVRYPKGSGPFPVIVFSHGAGGAGKNYFPLVQFWASHGYICLQPTHADSLSLQKEKKSLRSVKDLRREIEEELNDPDAVENRARDITLVLDSISEIENKIPELKGKIDRERVGVGGHSFGALTSQVIAGATVDGKEFSDHRPKAVLLLSGQGKGRAGLGEKSWEKITRPMMVMSGSLDTGAKGEAPQWRMEPYQFSPPGDKYSVFIEGAAHMSFTGKLAEPAENGNDRLIKSMGRETRGTDQKAVFDCVKAATLAFWDCHLKNDAAAKSYLQSDSLVGQSKGLVKFEKK